MSQHRRRRAHDEIAELATQFLPPAETTELATPDGGRKKKGSPFRRALL